MITTGGSAALGSWVARDQEREPKAQEFSWRAFAHRRLDRVLEHATTIPWDDSSRFVFFSDCHRGDNSRVDAFAKNSQLFLQALDHYYRQGFSYIEVGDGDELWKNRHLRAVQRAHSPVFDLLHRFHQRERLHLVVGNHDIQRGRGHRVDKDGLVAHEGFVFYHLRTGRRLLAVHGHQADFSSDYLSPLSRFTVRNIWRYLQFLGIRGWPTPAVGQIPAPALLKRAMRWLQAQRNRIEDRIVDWLRVRDCMVICGHTHRAKCAPDAMPGYFNCGSCITPGYITGLELVGGRLQLVRWLAGSPDGGWGKRQELTRPKALALA